MSELPAKILVLYWSKTGNTRAMAEAVAAGVVAEGAVPHLANVEDFDVSLLLDFHGIAVGTPVYYGQPVAALKRFFDDSVVVHGRLAGKVGAAFASSANVGGGNETACLSLLSMMMVHGMLALGAAQGDHYGPVSVGAPNEGVLAQCRVHGERLAKFSRRLAEARLRDGKAG